MADKSPTSRLRRAPTVSSFRDEPVGAYYLGRTHLVWCASTSLCGSLHYGKPDEADARELTELLEFVLHPSLKSVDIVMDSSELEFVDWDVFRSFGDYIRRRVEPWERVIHRQAVLVASSALGTMLAGMAPVVGVRHPLRFFGDRAALHGWLDRPEARTADAETKQLADEAREVSPTLRALADYLAGALHSPTVELAATRLGISSRTLQRELTRLGRSFSGELRRARLQAARALLSDTDEKIEVIARRVGFATSSQLSQLFRRELGELPAAYRARTRT